MNKIHVISPAPNRASQPYVVDRGAWDKDFLERATKKDESGFPIEGKFGISFGLPFDIMSFSEITREEDMILLIKSRADSKGVLRSRKSIQGDVKQLLSAYNSLKKGLIIALKKGIKVIAYIQLMSDYQFCPHENWGWHSWSYRVLKKVTQQPANGGDLLKTFIPNCLPLPTDLKCL